MSSDPLIQEVRAARHRISEECGHDIWKLYARYDALQQEMKAEGKHRFVDARLPANLREPAVTSGEAV